MKDDEFRAWLDAKGQQTSSVRTRVSDARRVEAHYGDLDEAFANDRLASILAALAYSGDDRASDRPNPTKIDIDGDTYNSLASYRSAVTTYRSFLEDGYAGSSQADRIRRFVIDHVVEPARARGEPRVEVLSGDVHREMGLQNSMPAVCSALGSSKMEKQARVRIVERQGPANSSTVRLGYELLPDDVSWAERELRRRYDDPSTDTDKMAGFHLKDGRAIALQRDVTGVRIWFEDEAGKGAPPVADVQRYDPEQARHSNLPARLKHRPPGGGTPRRVLLASVASLDELRGLLDWYEGAVRLDRSALEAMKLRFIEAYPDFRSFGDSGRFATDEDEYKRALIASAEALAARADLGDEQLGSGLLDLLAGKTSRGKLLGWRMVTGLDKGRNSRPGTLEAAAGALARNPDAVAAVEAFVTASWPVLSEGQQASLPYGDSRTIPTMLRALVRPAEMIGVRYQPFHNAGMALLGRPLFKNAPLSRSEIIEVLALAEAIFSVMRDDWQWQPRDLWDVQGFIWVTCQQKPDAAPAPSQTSINEGRTMPAPTNLILHGPPGTGKTFATAERAVRLCGETPPADREELMAAYHRLAQAGRIEFVTFHQSLAYEDFVEGLRPTQGREDGSAGFSLEVEQGVFRRIARRAETSKGPGRTDFRLGARQVFKMSIGEASNPDDVPLFEDAIANGDIILGFEDIDWSDARYASRDAILDACQEVASDGEQLNAMSGAVQIPHIFRNWMRVGDVVIVSKGNKLFRAIGLVEGDYRFEPREESGYSHRRKVRWLWVDRAGVPVEEIYARQFSMRSAYQMTTSELNVPALERYANSQQAEGSGQAEQFVLIIDEINRANISKVFGELITLLEADKRIGMPNELRLSLPYSKVQDFGVPANLHIIGTMNTADRSIALLDTALRRRFTFEELMPNPDLPALKDASARCGIDLKRLLTILNDRIEYLFDREHQIGHAYFIACTSREAVDETMRHRVIPLLAEYFYEDWSKVAAVLGDAEEGESDHEGGFLVRRKLAAPPGLGDASEAAPRWRWSVRAASFDYARLQ